MNKPAQFMQMAVRLLTAGILTCSAFAAEPEVIAKVGDTEIGLEEIRTSLASLNPREAAVISRDPALLNQLVRTLLVQRVLLKEAMEKQWDQQPEVAARLERVRDAAISEGYLQSISNPPADFPSETELQKAYDLAKPTLLVPKQYRLAQIFIAVPPGAEKSLMDAAARKLEVVKKALGKTDADFAVIARTDSEEKESASRGGEIGWLTEAQIQPEIRTQLGALRKDAITQPLQLSDGWHIIKCLDIKDAYTPSLPDIRKQLILQMRTEQAKATSQAYLAKLLQRNPVAINELALSRILEKSEIKP